MQGDVHVQGLARGDGRSGDAAVAGVEEGAWTRDALGVDHDTLRQALSNFSQKEAQQRLPSVEVECEGAGDVGYASIGSQASATGVFSCLLLVPSSRAFFSCRLLVPASCYECCAQTRAQE